MEINTLFEHIIAELNLGAFTAPSLRVSGGVLNDIDFERLSAFISAYGREFGELNIDLQSLYGIGQVHETLTRIVYYASVKEYLLKNLER